MSPVAPPAPHEKRPPFFQPEVVEIPQSVFNSSHGLLPRIERKLTESAAQPPGKMCECDSRKRGEVAQVPVTHMLSSLNLLSTSSEMALIAASASGPIAETTILGPRP